MKVEAEREQTSARVNELVDLPCLRKNIAREEFLVETRVDPTLKTSRKLADNNTGYFWKEGLLMQSSTNVPPEEIQIIVVPQCKRLNIIRLAHDKIGHLGY